VLGFASLAPAYMSYRWIENPIRSNLGPRGHRTRYLAAVCILAPVAAYIVLAASASSDLHKKAVKETQLAVQMHIDVQHGCDNDLPLSERVGSSCSWPAQSPEGTVLLIGDSNAGQFTEAVIEAAGHKHFSSTVATLSSCPFVDLELLTPTGDSARCHRFVTDSVAEIRRSRPSLVIIASSSTAYVTNDGFAFRSSGGAIARTRAEKAQLWEQGLASVLHGLDEAGVPVAVVHAVPHFPNFDLRMCPSMVRGLQSCGRSLTRQEVESQQRLTRSAEEQAIATAPNAVGVDFTDRLCTATHCATDRDGRFLYRDGNHLNVSGARTLVGEFSDLINRRAQKHT
jgi:hypothetical protein